MKLVRIRRWLGLESALDMLGAILAASNRVPPAPSAPPKPPKPFVSVLVYGTSKDGSSAGPSGLPLALGMAGCAGKITLVTHVPLYDVNVIVFCDLERVAIDGIFHGVDLVQAGVGDCPVARFRQWQVGTNLTVLTREREERG
jgi:hypothetical protein